jgi:cytosine/adenosine deaminase-related metal-dependent hydrolase
MSRDADIILANVRLPGGDVGDIRISGACIAEIGPGLALRVPGATTVDGAGNLVLPGLVDGHIHLDKTLTGMPWLPHPAGPDRMSRIETERRLRASLPPVAERAANLVRQCIAHGTTAIRTHVDIAPDIGLAHVEALLSLRARFAGQVDIQIVAFPQYGVLRAPGTADLLAAALDAGADLLGGIDPIGIDNDLDGQLDLLFALAGRKSVGIDIHLHDPGDDGRREIAGVCEHAQASGLKGRVTVSHGFCLGSAAHDDCAALADAMAAAGVSLVTHGGGASPLPPVKPLRARGVEVFAGNDDVRDPWSPYGEGDMLERAMLLAWRSGYRTDDDLAVALDCAGAAGKRVLGLADAGIAVGAPADLFTVPVETAAEAVARHPVRTLVMKRGRIVARGGAYAL